MISKSKLITINSNRQITLGSFINRRVARFWKEICQRSKWNGTRVKDLINWTMEQDDLPRPWFPAKILAIHVLITPSAVSSNGWLLLTKSQPPLLGYFQPFGTVVLSLLTDESYFLLICTSSLGHPVCAYAENVSPDSWRSINKHEIDDPVYTAGIMPIGGSKHQYSTCFFTRMRRLRTMLMSCGYFLRFSYLVTVFSTHQTQRDDRSPEH